MDKRMKILIAYDGSECADMALEDLRRAGLPREAEALVLSVADVFLPPPVTEADETFPFQVPVGVKRAHAHAAHQLAHARCFAERAATRVERLFPSWRVSHEATADSPAWAIIMKTDEWQPRLVVVGAHGHNVLGGRVILGSVSQRVLYEARASVRVARFAPKATDKPLRLVIGLDGSPDATLAAEAVAARAWPKGSEARLITVLDTVMCVTADPTKPAIVKWIEADEEQDWAWVRGIFEPVAERLRLAGLTSTVELRRGNPKHVLVEEAETWGADAIFVGAKGVRGIDRLLLGSVSATVAARAQCSVEVVRPKRTD